MKLLARDPENPTYVLNPKNPCAFCVVWAANAAMFRLEESLKEDVNLLAEYLTRLLESKSSAGAVARAFIASGLEQMRAQYPDLQKFLEQRRIKNHDSSKLTFKARGKKPPKAKVKGRNPRKRK
jgi:hypothetical protein